MEIGRALMGVTQREPEGSCGLLEGPQQALAEAWCPANVIVSYSLLVPCKCNTVFREAHKFVQTWLKAVRRISEPLIQ